MFVLLPLVPTLGGRWTPRVPPAARFVSVVLCAPLPLGVRTRCRTREDEGSGSTPVGDGSGVRRLRCEMGPVSEGSGGKCVRCPVVHTTVLVPVSPSYPVSDREILTYRVWEVVVEMTSAVGVLSALPSAPRVPEVSLVKCLPLPRVDLVRRLALSESYCTSCLGARPCSWGSCPTAASVYSCLLVTWSFLCTVSVQVCPSTLACRPPLCRRAPTRAEDPAYVPVVVSSRVNNDPRAHLSGPPLSLPCCPHWTLNAQDFTVCTWVAQVSSSRALGSCL